MSGPAFGVGFRRPHFSSLQAQAERLDFFEILPENFMGYGGRPRRALAELAEKLPAVLHGVALNIGGLDPLDKGYLKALKSLCDELAPPWFSDHLCMSAHAGERYHDLLPIPFTDEALDHLVPRIQTVQDYLGRPFLLENPSTYFRFPENVYGEGEFLAELCARTGCGLLLDINNIYVNAENHGEDASDFLNRLPLNKVRQFHLAGHDASGPFIVDTHNGPCIAPVVELYLSALRRCPDAWVLLEWDNDLPPVEELLSELDRLRDLGVEALL